MGVAGARMATAATPQLPINTPAAFRTVTPATIRRGQAVTLLLGEKCLNRDLLWTGRCDDDSGWVSGWDADINRWGYNVANGGPLSPMPDYHMPKEGLMADTGNDANYYARFGSSHPSGSNFAMCDGSVRSVSYNVSWLVFALLLSRDLKRPRRTVLGRRRRRA